MAERVIVWTKTAAKHRREILKYWVNKTHSKIFAEKLITEVFYRTKIIAKNPKSFICTNYPETRISAMGHYSILYRFDDKKLSLLLFGTTYKILKSFYN